MKKPPFNDYVRYTQIVFQAVATIGLFVLGGHFTDKYFQFKQPWLTLILGIAGLIIGLYLLIKNLNQPN